MERKDVLAKFFSICREPFGGDRIKKLSRNESGRGYALSYIKWADGLDRLNQACAEVGCYWQEDDETLKERQVKGGKMEGAWVITCRLSITVTFPDGVQIKHNGIGECNPIGHRSYGDAMKASRSNALKTCLMRFGIGIDIWRDDADLEYEQEELPVETAKRIREDQAQTIDDGPETPEARSGRYLSEDEIDSDTGKRCDVAFNKSKECFHQIVDYFGGDLCSTKLFTMFMQDGKSIKSAIEGVNSTKDYPDVSDFTDMYFFRMAEDHAVMLPETPPTSFSSYFCGVYATFLMKAMQDPAKQNLTHAQILASAQTATDRVFRAS